MPTLSTRRGGRERWASSGGRVVQSGHGRGYGAAPESGWPWRVMRDAGVRTWEQNLDKVRRGEICAGAWEAGRSVQRRGCKIAFCREWGPKGVYQEMAEAGEGRRAAAALLWSRRGGGPLSCCGRQKRNRWRGQGKGLGARRRTWRMWSWRWSWKRRARGREVGKGDKPRGECGRMCTKFRSRRLVRHGRTTSQRVTCGREGRWGRGPRVRGS